MAETIVEQDLHGFDSFESKLGDLLRGERATLGKSLLDVQRDLRIKAVYIAAIENCDLDVFENRAFIAGYVRSYARYLLLDPEKTFGRFCVESGFQGANPELGRRREGKSSIGATAALSTRHESIKFKSMPGRGVAVAAVPTLTAMAPLLVLLALILGLGYGAWMIIQDIQRVDIAPIDNTPEVLDQIDGTNFAAGLDSMPMDRAGEQAFDITRLYSVAETNAPVVVPRDGPIAFIDPNAYGTVLESTEQQVESVQAPPEPVLDSTPVAPGVGVYAQEPAWIRVSAANGNVIFETILDAGATYTIPADLDGVTLRAGNATAVYVMVDGAAYGPVGRGAAVVKNVSLAAVDVSAGYPAVDQMTGDMQRAVLAMAQAETDPQ